MKKMLAISCVVLLSVLSQCTAHKAMIIVIKGDISIADTSNSYSLMDSSGVILYNKSYLKPKPINTIVEWAREKFVVSKLPSK